MVFYLDIDYLSNAIDSRKNVLAKCLITVPQHLDRLETWPCVSAAADEKYRTPWIKAKADEQFLLEESVLACKEAAKLTSLPDVTQPELHESRKADSSFCASATFDLDCDIVPSSNPSSEETFDTEFESENLFEEKFQKENLKELSCSIEELKLEIFIPKDLDDVAYIAETKNLFTLKSLAGKLKELAVADPLRQAVKLTQTEKYSSKEDDDLQHCQSILAAEQDAGIFKETYEVEKTVQNEKEIEDVLVENSKVPDTVDAQAEVSKLIVTRFPKTLLEEQQELSVKQMFEDAFHPQEELPNKIETLDYNLQEQTNVTFMEINDITDEEVDKFCDTAWLDSPMASGPEETLDWKITRPTCEPLEMSQSKPRLLTEDQQKALENTCLSSEYFLDQIQADRLPEPHQADMDFKAECDTGLQHIRKMFGVAADRGIGSLELDLPWEIVNYSDPSTNSWRMPAALTIDRSLDGPAQNTDVEPTEKFQKFTSADIKACQATALDDVKAKDLVQSNHFTTVTATSAENASTCTNQLLKVPDVVQSKQTTNISTTSAENVSTNQPLKIPVKSRTSSYSLDPVRDFMALRSKSAQLQKKTKECSDVDIQAVPVVQMQPQILNQESKRGSKHHVVNVKLSDELLHMVDFIQETAIPYVQQLRQSGDISASSTLQSLTADVTKFIVKQREKTIKDMGGDACSDDIYKTAVCLYALCQTVEHLKHSCLEAAIGFLCAVLEEYPVVKKSVLGSVLKKLVEKQAELYHSQSHHPKVVRLCKEVETWLRKKRAKSGDNEQKILVLVKHDMPSLLNCLKTALGNGCMLLPEILTSHKSEDIIQSLDAHNCLISSTKYVQETFPWAQFCLVVEYEYQAGSDWQQLCQRQHIRHIGIQLQHEQTQTATTVCKDWSTRFLDKQICLIGSLETVTSNTELLQLLESKHNILLIERDYRAIAGQRDIVFSDVDVDENTCIIIEDLATIQDDCSVQAIVRKLVALNIKYTKCFCLLASGGKSKGYELPGHVITHLSHLKAATANITAKLQDYSVKFLHCGDISELAMTVRCVGEQCLSELPADQQDKWLDRSWLGQEISQEERFLLMFPCLSSYNAQVMLRSIDLQTLIRSSEKDLVASFPDIAQRIIAAFCLNMKISRGLQLQGLGDQEDESEQATGYNMETCSESGTQNSHPAVFRGNREDASGCTVANSKRSLDDDSLSEATVAMKIHINDQEKSYRHPNGRAHLHSNGQFDVPARNTEEFSDAGLRQAENIENKHAKENRLLNVTTATDTTSRKRTFPEMSWNNLNTFVTERRQANIYKQDHASQYVVCNNEIAHQTSDLEPLLSTDIAGADYSQLDLHDIESHGNIAGYQSDRKSLYVPISNKDKPDIVNPNPRRHHIEYIPADMRPDNVHFSNASINRTENSDDRMSRVSVDTYRKTTTEPKGSQPVETIDYNHGLPYKEGNTTEHSSENMYSARETPTNNFQQLMSDFLKEYLPSSEVDSRNDMPSSDACATVHSESGPEMFLPAQRFPKEQARYSIQEDIHIGIDKQVLSNMVNGEQIFPFKPTSTPLEPRLKSVPLGQAGLNKQIYGQDVCEDMCSSNYNQNEWSNTDSTRFQADSNLENYNQELIYNTEDHNLARNHNVSSVPFYNSNNNGDSATRNVATESCLKQNPAEAVPHAIDSLRGSVNSKSHARNNFEQAKNGNSIYLNPNLDRFSLKPSLITATGARDSSHRKDFASSLADDLRETTRRLLENSQQFSKLDGPLVRRPLQMVNIGLAQPLPRKSPAEGEGGAAARSERQLMEQSMWASDNSPPMDLDEEQDSGAMHPLDNGVCNRAVFTYQTPSKKRKLTYQRVPGKKGQTKLIFT